MILLPVLHLLAASFVVLILLIFDLYFIIIFKLSQLHHFLLIFRRPLLIFSKERGINVGKLITWGQLVQF